jgi:hypothetical protein
MMGREYEPSIGGLSTEELDLLFDQPFRFGYISAAAAAAAGEPSTPSSSAGGIQLLQHQSVDLSGAAVLNPNLIRFGAGLGESTPSVPGIVQRRHQSVELGATSFSVHGIGTDAVAGFEIAQTEPWVPQFEAMHEILKERSKLVRHAQLGHDEHEAT